MSIYKKILLWLLCGLFFIVPSIASGAGVNVESRRASREKNGIFGDVNIGGNLQYGNTNIMSLNASSLVGYKKNRHTVFGFGNFSYTSESLFQRDDIQNSSMGHIRYNYQIKKWLYWELFTQAQTDQNLFVDFRYITGTGMRFVPYRTDEHLFVLGSSYMPEYEILDKEVILPFPSDLDSRKTWVHRWSNYISYRANITDQFVFQTTVYAQPRFDRFGDLKLFNENNFTMEINNLLDFGVSLNVGFDREPPTVCNEGVCKPLSRLDLGTQIGVRFKF